MFHRKTFACRDGSGGSMLNRFIRGTTTFARRRASQSAALALIVRDTFNGFMTTAHHTLMLLGIAAIAAWGILFIKPDLIDRIKALSPYAEQAETAPASSELLAMPAQTSVQLTKAVAPTAAADAKNDKLAAANARQQQWVTNWLSKRYRV